MKNRDKINNLSNAELAEILSKLGDSCMFCINDHCGLEPCVDGVKAWLESECEENDKQG